MNVIHIYLLHLRQIISQLKKISHLIFTSLSKKM